MAAHPGSYCTPPKTGVTTKGTVLVCALASDGRNRMVSAGGTNGTPSAATSRRALLKQAREAGVKVKRGLPDEEVRGLIAAAEGLPRRTTEPTPAPPLATGDRIRAAFHQLTPGHGDYLMLSDLRSALPDISREDFDAHLARLNQDPNVHIVPESNQKVLTQQERDGAVHIGNQAKHLISIAQPLDPGARQRVTAQGVANASDADLAMAQRDPWTRSAILDAIRVEVRARSAAATRQGA